MYSPINAYYYFFPRKLSLEKFEEKLRGIRWVAINQYMISIRDDDYNTIFAYSIYLNPLNLREEDLVRIAFICSTQIKWRVLNR